MKYKKEIAIIFITIIILSSCSMPNKGVENCKIEKILKVTSHDNLYYMQVKFNHCNSKELRETLIKEEIRNQFPLLQNETIYIEEYLGKMYNEYKYEIKVE
jgi:hypothetical protein